MTHVDPVCGMDVEAESAAGTSDYEGQTYYFCGAGCKKAFDADPEKYVGQADMGHDHSGHEGH